MNKLIKENAKRVGQRIIELSDRLSSSMQSWAEAPARPNDFSVSECVGFIMKDDQPGPLTVLVDLIAPASEGEPVLRLWAIKTAPDAKGNERFDNIQLDFAVDGREARDVAQKAGSVTREDLQSLLVSDSTQLNRFILSDSTGVDQSSQAQLGVRYDSQSPDAYEEETIVETFDAILSRIG